MRLTRDEVVQVANKLTDAAIEFLEEVTGATYGDGEAWERANDQLYTPLAEVLAAVDLPGGSS